MFKYNSFNLSHALIPVCCFSFTNLVKRLRHPNTKVHKWIMTNTGAQSGGWISLLKLRLSTELILSAFIITSFTTSFKSINCKRTKPRLLHKAIDVFEWGNVRMEHSNNKGELLSHDKSTKRLRREMARRQVNCTNKKNKKKRKSCFNEVVVSPSLSPSVLLVIPYFFQGKDFFKCHGFQWMPVRLKQAIHAASWFSHDLLHTNQPRPSQPATHSLTHSLVCHSIARWRRRQKVPIKISVVMSAQKKGENNKKKEC